LCHLLANNTNYAPRFRPLGAGLLTGQQVSFEQTYGPMAKEISFEYREFLKCVERGYRADLCSWDWKAKFRRLNTAAILTAPVDAQRGWQPSRLTVAEGQEYEFSAQGTWVLSKSGDALDAQGAPDGTGKLLAAILDDPADEYELSAPIELGKHGSFTAPRKGNLYLRCQEGWHNLADNKGRLTVKIKLKDKGDPLPAPGPKGDSTGEDKGS
jgi:hypothetical protein